MITIDDINNDYARNVMCKKLGKKKNEVKAQGRKFFLRHMNEIISADEQYCLLDSKAQERFLLTHRIYHVYRTYENIKDKIKRELYRANQESLFNDKSKCYAIVSNYEKKIVTLHELTEGSSLDITAIGDDKEEYIVDQLVRRNRFVGYLTNKKLEEAQRLVTSTMTFTGDENKENIIEIVGRLTRELKSKE